MKARWSRLVEKSLEAIVQNDYDKYFAGFSVI
jgi:hypothetical protein